MAGMRIDELTLERRVEEKRRRCSMTIHGRCRVFRAIRIEPSPDCACRPAIRFATKGLFDLSVTCKMAVTFAILALLGAVPGPICQANAQTIGSSYTSTAPKNCRFIGKPSELDG